MIEVLIVLLFLIFTLSLLLFERKWFSPFFLFSIPFLLVCIFSSFFQKKWDFSLSTLTVCLIFVGVLSFLAGCVLAGKDKTKQKGEIKNIAIRNLRLFIIVAFESVCFYLFLREFLSYASAKGMTLSETINEVMILMKFENIDLIKTPVPLSICLQLNYISGYIFAYLIARRVLLKEKYSLILLIIGFAVANLTCFLGGSRGPIVENLLALVFSFVFVYYIKTGKSFFKARSIVILTAVGVVSVSLFFSLSLLMGRRDADSNALTEFAKYFGAQIYNLNYFVTKVDTRSGFFGLNTLSSFISDFHYLGIDVSTILNEKVSLFFVEANRNSLGNVFTCFFDFYADGGLFGVFLFSFIMGFISQKVYLKAFSNGKNQTVWMSVFLYVSVNLIFCFFGNRFYSNVFNLLFIIKLTWLILISKFLVRSANEKRMIESINVESQTI